MKTVSQCLGENLKKLRRERSLTQGEFAAVAGVSLSFVQNLEKGKKWAGPRTITMLARALNVSESTLFEDCDRINEIDPKQILLMMARALGIGLTEDSLKGVKVKASVNAHFTLYELMPDDVCHELSELCRQPGWDWESFRRRLKSNQRRA